MRSKRIPFDPWTAHMQLGLLMAETQAVVTMRVLGMMGLWNVTRGENSRMVDEKPPALLQAAMNAAHATLRGEGPDQVMLRAIRPLRSKTRSNSRRLAKRGPKFN